MRPFSSSSKRASHPSTSAGWEREAASKSRGLHGLNQTLATATSTKRILMEVTPRKRKCLHTLSSRRGGVPFFEPSREPQRENGSMGRIFEKTIYFPPRQEGWV